MIATRIVTAMMTARKRKGAHPAFNFKIGHNNYTIIFSRKNKNKQQNYTVVANPYSKKGPQIMVVKKKNKQAQSAKKEYKRIPCTCQAREHPLINNCLKCGKIVCEQEGPGPCFFCGNYVLPRNATPGALKPNCTIIVHHLYTGNVALMI
jgi:hypothetical protein